MLGSTVTQVSNFGLNLNHASPVRCQASLFASDNVVLFAAINGERVKANCFQTGNSALHSQSPLISRNQTLCGNERDSRDSRDGYNREYQGRQCNSINSRF